MSAFPGCHGASERIGFSSTKTCGNHDQLNHLFLKNWNTERPIQDSTDLFRLLLFGLKAFSAS